MWSDSPGCGIGVVSSDSLGCIAHILGCERVDGLVGERVDVLGCVAGRKSNE